MERGMQRTADRADIWQDRLIYDICNAIWYNLQELAKMKRKEAHENEKA